MDKQLSPETEAALKKLAQELGAIRCLDDESTEELYGHLEDKTLGYLSGEEGVSEADAVLLTREHFGVPAHLADAVATAHHAGIPIGAAQRFFMVATVTLVASILVGGIMERGLALVHGVELPKSIAFVVLFVQYTGVVTWIFVILAAWMLRAWQRRLTAGVPFTLRSWKTKCLALAFALLLVALFVSWTIPITAPASDSIVSEISQTLRGNMGWMYYGSLLAWPLLWIRWWDNRSGNIATMTAGVISWMGFQFAIFLLWNQFFFLHSNGSLWGVSLWDHVKHEVAGVYTPLLLMRGGAAFAFYLLYAARRDGVRIRSVKASPVIQ